MRRAADWWARHFLGAELGVSLVIAGAFVAWAEAFGGLDDIRHTLAGNRAALYASLASVWGALLGFAITAVSIVLGYAATPRLAVVRESAHYGQIWRVFFSAIRAIALTTVAALIGLLIDKDGDPSTVVLYLNVWTTSYAGLRLYRTVWVLQNIVSIVAAPISRDASGGDQ